MSYEKNRRLEDAIINWIYKKANELNMEKKYLSNLIMSKSDSISDVDVIYMKPLNTALKKVMNYFFGHSMKILDVTAGERMSWNKTILSNEGLDCEKLHDVTFFDASPLAHAEIIGDVTKDLGQFPDKSFDLIYFDPPFTKPENLIEGFGIKKSKTPGRHFYARSPNSWIPPEKLFELTWKEFNRIAKVGIIIKIAERYEDSEEIPVTSYMDYFYNMRFNKESRLFRISKIGFRGVRGGGGAKMKFAQRVLSYYAIYLNRDEFRTGKDIHTPIKSRFETKI